MCKSHISDILFLEILFSLAYVKSDESRVQASVKAGHAATTSELIDFKQFSGQKV